MSTKGNSGYMLIAYSNKIISFILKYFTIENIVCQRDEIVISYDY